ncbi:hypothetical protein [Sphingomonas prati]|uniref:Uncharacterized protein n=1 Tax=Sphingomonas prati TaxID=1843237 RepID=A0A7W9F198_9SPHN|nr:hypothetical protein [Sphingomonas prati]MBB5729078.1 hypothetical protein [Sphingomonas prati]
MSHTPPVPDASVSPFPIQPAPHGHVATPTPATPAAEPHASSSDRNRLIAGAAVGIGSAAIVAALLYTNRKPGKAPHPAPKDHLTI